MPHERHNLFVSLMKKAVALAIAIIMFPVCAAFANPTQGGSSGLIAVPSAETLDAGNICIGAWTDYSENKHLDQKSALIVPITITLGIGTFWEVFGAYPNILFNSEEEFSGRGTIDLGTKLRFLGDRNSFFKMAGEFVAQRHLSENNSLDGITDLSGKLITSFSRENYGAHLYGGYLFPGKTPGVALENRLIYGAGIEYMPIPRLKLMAELTGQASSGMDDNTMEASGGVQYYINPHLTASLSVGTGFGVNAADMRVVAGLSSCQGVGTYVKPIPSIGKKPVDIKPKEVLKPLKIIPISTLLLKASAPQVSPASKLEVEVESDREEVIIKPYGQVTIAPQQASSNLTSPVIPVEIPLKNRDEDISIQPQKTLDREASAIDYTLNRIRGITPLYGVDVKGTQAAIPQPAVLPERMAVYRKFRFPDVTFDFDQWTLSAEGKKMLSEVADQIRKDKKWLYIKIDGHTDSIGSLGYNMDLSLKRAIAAATYLISREGVDPTKIFIKGFGKSTPIADNSSAEGRRKNRRTEILFLVGKDVQ